MIRFLNRYWSIPAVISVFVEGTLLMLSVWLAFYFRLGEHIQEFTFFQLMIRALIFTAVVGVVFYLSGLYSFQTRMTLRQTCVRIWRSLIIATVSLWAIYYMLPGLVVGRGVFALSLGLGLVFVTSWRVMLRWLLSTHHFNERVLIVGADEDARLLAREMLSREHQGCQVVGFLDNDPKLQGVSVVNPRVLGTTAQAKSLALEHDVTRIVVARRNIRDWLDMDSLLSCKTAGIPVERGEDYFERLTGKLVINSQRKAWLVFSDGFVVSPSVLFWKRLLDAIVALGALVVSAPVMILTAIAIRLESPGPVLFRQERVGRGGEPFQVLKFRSMCQDAEAEGDAVWASAGDSRVTRVGRLIRRSRIDELPQLWNVLTGDMSLVGPRPERPCFVRQLMELSALYEQRHVVRPGLTGWAQINASYAATLEESLEKLQYDLFYIKNLSVLLDISILLSTARAVLLARGGR